MSPHPTYLHHGDNVTWVKYPDHLPRCKFVPKLNTKGQGHNEKKDSLAQWICMVCLVGTCREIETRNGNEDLEQAYADEDDSFYDFLFEWNEVYALCATISSERVIHASVSPGQHI